jgi:hypothetical protein
MAVAGAALIAGCDSGSPPCLHIVQGPTDQLVPAGASATFEVGAVTDRPKDPVYFVWERSNDGGTSWAEIPFAADFRYVLQSAQATPASTGGDDGALFRAHVSTACRTAWSSEARLTVTAALPPPPGFAIHVSPSAVTLAQGAAETSQITVTRDAALNGWPISFTLLDPSPPAGLTISFAPETTSGAAATLTVAAALSVQAGNYALGFEARATPVSGGTGVVRFGSLQVEVKPLGTVPPPAEDFSITPAQPTLTLEQNAIGAVDISISRTLGFTDPVGFAVSGLPPGAAAWFDPAGPTGGNTKRLVVQTQSTARLGRTPVTIVATGGNLTRTTTLTLEVTPGTQFCANAAAADSWVNPAIGDGSPGVGTVLRVGSGRTEDTGKTYLAFDLRGLAAPVGKVELVLALAANLGAADANSTRTVVVRGIADNADWAPGALPEAAILWSNAPKNDTTQSVGFVGEGASASDRVRVLGSFVVFAADAPGKLYRLDITEFVRWAIGLDQPYSNLATSDADRIVTIMLANNRVYSVHLPDYTEFHSREAALECQRPHLEVYTF